MLDALAKLVVLRGIDLPIDLTAGTDALRPRGVRCDRRGRTCVGPDEELPVADHELKAMSADIETPVFETPAFTIPPPLAKATVAIVTTASLHHSGQDDFAPGDTGFRVLDGSRRDLMTGHWSPNFDTLGFAADMNVVFPLDRLDELAAAGTIGHVADEHLSYAGNQFDLSAVRLDSGPAGARRLREQGVDVVLLTPV